MGCFLGCLIAAVIGIAALGGVTYLGFREIMKKTEAAAADLKAKGFEEEKADTITKDAVIHGKKLLNSKYAVVVTAGSDSELAMIGFMGVVDGPVKGDLYFRGGALVIGPTAAVFGDVDVQCYNVIVQGYVQGQIKGDYKQLDETERKKTPPAPEGGEARPSDGRPTDELPPSTGPEAPPAAPQPPTAPEPPPAPAPESPAAPPAPTPPAEPQPNAPAPQPPADTPAPPPPAGTQAEPTPPTPQPTEPAPTPPAPAPPSQ